MNTPFSKQQNTPKKKKKAIEKQPRPGKSNKRKMQLKRNSLQMSSYIYKVMKTVTQDQTISKKAMGIMDSFLWDIFGRITALLYQLVRARGSKKGSKTLSTVDIQTAVKLVLPGELASHAIVNGVNAVAQYLKSKRDVA